MKTNNVLPFNPEGRAKSIVIPYAKINIKVHLFKKTILRCQANSDICFANIFKILWKYSREWSGVIAKGGLLLYVNLLKVLSASLKKKVNPCNYFI